MNSLIFKTSQLDNSEGGDISPRGGYLVDDRVDFNLSSEESFFSTDIYRGYYLQNTNDKVELRNITLRVLGGTGSYVDESLDFYIEDLLTEAYRDLAVDENAQMIDRSPSGAVINPESSIWNPDLLTFYDFIYSRRFMGKPPYNIPWDELDVLDTDYPNKASLPGRQMFEDIRTWFRQNIIKTSPTRKSLFGQLNTEIYAPSTRVLGKIDDQTPEYPFSTQLTIPYLAPYTVKSKDNYWGFYLKLETDFIPDWELTSDFSFILVNWDEYTIGQNIPIKRRKLFKITVNGNLKEINMYNLGQVQKFYQYYPPYFLPFEDSDV